MPYIPTIIEGLGIKEGGLIPPGFFFDIPAAVLNIIDRFERANQSHVEITIDVIFENIVMLGFKVYASPQPGPNVIFTSLNLWQEGESEYSFNMQDGKVCGFEIADFSEDVASLDPAEFIMAVVDDIFSGFNEEPDSYHCAGCAELCELCKGEHRECKEVE
jgi:hypothetical protein